MEWSYDRVAIKSAAREAVREAVPKAWKMTLLFLVLSAMVPAVISSLIPNALHETLGQMYLTSLFDPDRFLAHEEYWSQAVMRAMGQGSVLALFVGVALWLYQLVMQYGYIGWSLRTFARKESGYAGLFAAFGQAGRVIVAELLAMLFRFLRGLVVFIGYVALLVLGIVVGNQIEALGIVLVLVAFAVLVVGLAWIGYRYTLVAYFVMDEPELGPMEAVTASWKAMRGNVLRRLVFDLSFLGWHLLQAVIALGITLVGMAIGLGIVAAGAMWETLLSDPAVLAAAVVPIALGAVVGLLATLPLTVWLLGYQQTAVAGFYLAVRGDAPQRAVRPSAPPIPPAPPMPPMPDEAQSDGTDATQEE